MGLSAIAIIGLGLIGGSFALALKEHGFKGTISGISRTPSRLERAYKRGIIDRFTTDAASGVREADLIMLSTNVGSYVSIMAIIKDHIKSGAIVTDVGSVKAEPVKELEVLMPEGVHFVGAHPIAGSEKSGVDAADPHLFDRARCIITPTSKTDKEALKTVCHLWESIGSQTVLMNCDDHDLTFGAVSHMPHVAAYALINTIIDAGESILSFGGSGLKDTTRIALSSPNLWKDICFNNKANVIKLLKSFESHLCSLRQALENNDENFLQFEFSKAQSARMTLE